MSQIPADVIKAAEAVMNARSPSMERWIFEPLYATIRRQATETIARAIMAERERCANKAREFAAHYSQGSDGRNTFVMLAEWIEAGQ